MWHRSDRFPHRIDDSAIVEEASRRALRIKDRTGNHFDREAFHNSTTSAVAIDRTGIPDLLHIACERRSSLAQGGSQLSSKALGIAKEWSVFCFVA
jgi:hypothetical protein